MRTASARWSAAVALLVTGGVAGGVAGCAGGPSPTAVPAAPTVTTAPAAGTSTTPTSPPDANRGRTTYVAEATGSRVRVYGAPRAGRPSLVLPNPWLLNGATTHPVRQWFLVESTRPDGWVRILLPTRPNGGVGWLAPGAARLLVDPYRIDVSLHAHRLTLRRGTDRVYSGAVAVGAPATPTPTGLFYLRVLLRNDDPTSVYGPYAYGLSAHSEALTTFNGGDAEIGLHGNDDASVLGSSVTHGCIRMSNREITRLAALLPLGTPVHIHA